MSLRSSSLRLRHLRRWMGTFAPAAMGAVLSAITVVALLLLGWYAYREVLRADREFADLHARVLDDHASRAIDGVSLTLTALSRQVEETDVFGGTVRANTLLSQPLTAMPYVRSLHLLGDDGQVLASSDAAELNTRIDMQRLGELPAVGQDLIGRFIAGRGVSAMAQDAPVVGASNVGFFPLSRALKAQSGRVVYLVALLNPDSFSSFQLATLDNPNAAAYLMRYDGELLASSSLQSPPYGSTLSGHLIFKQFLPRVEFSSFMGEGVLPQEQVGAFRLVKNRPLIVLVEKPYSEALHRWVLTMRWFALVAVLTILFITAMSMAAHHNLRRRLKAFADLRHARAEVVRREHELRVLLQSVEELIFRTDVDGNIVYVNDSWVDLRGSPVEDAVGVALVSLVDLAERALVSDLLTVNANNTVRTATARMRAADGKLRQFDFAVVPLREQHAVIGFVGSAVDVTQRVDAEHALQRQLAFVARVLEVSPLPVSTFDGQGRYATVNRAWEDFMGMTRSDVIGRRGAHFMTSEDAALHAQRDAELVWRGDTVRYEAKVTHRDGSRRDVIVTKVLLPGSSAEESGWLSTMMDVSEFRAVERATREAKEAAEESSRVKSEFMANVTHELRTPLQAILGFSELGTARSAEHARLQTMFKEINAGGQRMLALVNNLLDISRIDNADGPVNLVDVDLRDLVNAVVQELQGVLYTKSLQLNVSLGHQPVMVRADGRRLQQVVRNVMGNAIKYSPHHEAVDVSVVARDNLEAWVQVRDRGPGIPSDELESIFEPFEQSSRTKDGAGGSGLGLAICRKIMDAHGGRIESANMSDGGAVFTVIVPQG